MLLFILTFLFSVLLTGGIRMILARYGVMDMPNPRSSHAIPVPRGGGVAILLVFLSAIVWLFHRQMLPAGIVSALVGGGLAIGAIGFLDDCFRLSFWPRLIVHSLAAAWALWCSATTQAPQVVRGAFCIWAVRGLELTGLVWLTNLFNFMDGIDGLAALEAVCASAFGAILLLGNGAPAYSSASWALAAASLGFLVWNWPPAKVFMGDAGSGFLGFSLGVLAIFSSKTNLGFAWPWLILLAAFWVDATLTLLRRIVLRESWIEAHRDHAYQHASQLLGSHAKVSLSVAAINAGWLFPFAWAALKYPAIAPVTAMIALVPVVCLTFRFEAGARRPGGGFRGAD